MLLKLVSVFIFLAAGAGLVWYMLRGDRGKHEPRGALWVAVGFGFLGIALAAWAEMFLPSQRGLGAGGLFLIALGVGFIEESAKFLPLALYIRGKSYFNEHTDGIIYFVISGLVFGITENVIYTLVYSQGQPGGNFVGPARIITTLFFHAASAGIAGYYLAKAKIHQQSLWKPGLALASMMLLHATYDFMLFYSGALARSGNTDTLTDGTALLVVGCIVMAFSISGLLNLCLFLYYRRAKQWDYSVGLAIDPKLAPVPLAAAYPQAPAATPAYATPAPLVPAQQSVAPPPAPQSFGGNLPIGNNKA